MKKGVSLRIVAIYLENKATKKKKLVNALLDDGADRTFVAESLAKELNMRGITQPLNMHGVGNTQTRYQAMISNINIQPANSSSKLDRRIMVTVIPKPLGDLNPSTWSSEKLLWKHLENMPDVMLAPGGVPVLIGATEADLIAAIQADLVGPPGGPVGRLCHLGWSVLGAFSPEEELDESATQNALISVHDQLESGSLQMSERLIEESTTFAAVDLQMRKEILDADLNELFLKQCEIEALPDDEMFQLSREDRYAVQIMNKTMKRKLDGSYECGALWKRGEPSLPNNYAYCRARHFNFLEMKSMKRPEVKQGVCDIIETWQVEKYVEKVPEHDRRPKDANYLPIFVVIKETSDSTKYRVVVDGKAVYRNSSLNKSTLTGPCMIKDIMCTLSRFRLNEVAVMADVTQMFLRISLAQKDRVYHRFLWNPDPNVEPDEYQFNVHCFGNAGSPAVAISVIREHARLNKKRFPRAVETMLESTHVDDTLDSFETEEEAIAVCKNIATLYDEIKMWWRKLASNSEAVMKAFDQKDWAKDYEITGPNMEMNFPTQKALGIVWHTDTDDFSFPTGNKVGFKPPGEVKTTKRSILRQEARLFDPLGFISPILIAAKITLQKCWAEGLGWDDPVPDHIRLDWEKWVDGAQDLPLIRLPRVLKPTRESAAKAITLHAFCDASKDAYAAVIYSRVEYEDDHVFINLLASRARLAPLKGLSIPRLELLAAKLAASLIGPLANSIGIKTFHCWSDSMNVICWIRSEVKSLKMYVANRVDSILLTTKVEDWNYVNTLENPADIASRGTTIPELRDSDLWWQGPDWLAKDESLWPKTALAALDEEGKKELKEADAEKEELNTDSFANIVVPPMFDFDKFSAWNALLKVATRTVQAIRPLMRALSKKVAPKLPSEFHFPTDRRTARHLAESWVLREVQKLSFREERSTLQAIRERHLKKDISERTSKNKDGTISHISPSYKVKGSSPIARLRPFLDNNGVIRINSRVACAKFLGTDQKYPILLPQKGHFTKMIARHYHFVVLKHVGGHAYTLNEIQTKFWIVNGTQVCRSIIHQCAVCARWRRKPIRQVQGPLPDYRIPQRQMRPFAHTIVDAAGPFNARLRPRIIDKRYVIVFGCMVFRAIHLEVADDLSEDAFMNCFARFTSRRGIPEVVRSDNGGNFVAAAKLLRETFQKWDDTTPEHFGYGDVKWIFSAPYAPHTQGSIERMVGMAKQGLHSNIGDEIVSEQALQTVTTSIEGILNDRPITHSSVSPDDVRPLTPNDFLRPLDKRPPPPTPIGTGSKYKSCWLHAQFILDRMWSMFVKQMVPTLHSNTVKGWDRVRRDTQVGDVVSVLDDKKRGSWPIARVVEVMRSADDRVRFAKVQMARKTGKSGAYAYEPKTYVRNINQLMLIVPEDIGNDEPTDPAERKAAKQAAKDKNPASKHFRDRVYSI